jgi:hypothetical protein
MINLGSLTIALAFSKFEVKISECIPAYGSNPEIIQTYQAASIKWSLYYHCPSPEIENLWGTRFNAPLRALLLA